MCWNRMVGRWLLILVFASSLSGCATIVSGRRYEVTVDNSGGPTYFSVLDNKNHVVHSGVTPQQVTLKSSAAPFRPAKYHVVYAGQDGPHHSELKSSVNWWTAGNIVIGGVPGIVIDAGTGALWKLQPKVIGQVPSQMVVSNEAQGAAVLAGHSGQGPATADVSGMGTVRPEDNVRPASFENRRPAGQTGQGPPTTRRFSE